MSTQQLYPVNVIQEALCEFRLKPHEGFTWSPKLAGQIFTALGPSSFPGMEPHKEIGVELLIDNATGQAQQRIVEGPSRVRYSSPDETELVQVSPALFAYNLVRKYPGWNRMQSETLEKWGIVAQHLQPSSFERIALRYINCIPVPPSDPVSEWLKPSTYLPEAIARVQGDMMHRMEGNLGGGQRISVSVVRQPSAMERVFLDIERSCTVDGLPSDAQILDLTSTLHDDIWEVFASARTPRLTRYLEGGG